MLRGFYAIVDVPPSQMPAHPRPISELLRPLVVRLLAASPCMLQLRAKTATPAQLLEWALAVLPLCRDHGVPLCVNDRLDVALAAKADAVHLGQDDLPLAAALRVLQDRSHAMKVGVSTHNLSQALAAAAGGAHYIGFGPIYPTRTKQDPDPVVGVDALAGVVKAVSVPVVAIGGIALESIAEVANTGVAAAAVVSAVLKAADPYAAASHINFAFQRKTTSS